MKPDRLQVKITDRLETGRPPSGADEDKRKWRQDAIYKADLMYDLIQENVKYEDKQRVTTSSSVDPPTDVNTLKNVCRNYQHGRCSLGDKCTRTHIDVNGTILPTRVTTSKLNTQTKSDCWHWTDGRKYPQVLIQA